MCCLMFPSGRGVPIRDVLGKSKMILGLLEGIPTMHKGEIAMVNSKKYINDPFLCVYRAHLSLQR